MDNRDIDAQQLELQPVAKLDLSKYRTRDLVGRLTELLSIPGALFTIALTWGFMVMLALVTFVIMFIHVEISGFEWVGLCAYALMYGIGLGPWLGVLRVIHASLRNVEEILRIILGIAQQAAEDADNLQSGSARLPSGPELVAQVYEEVVMPTIEQVIESAFSIFGTPIVWIYRRTLGSAVRYLIRSVQKAPTLTAEQEAEIQENLEAGITVTATYSTQIQNYTGKAASIVNSIGGGLRAYVMRPLLIVYCGLLLVASLPVLLFRYWAGTEAETEAIIESIDSIQESIPESIPEAIELIPRAIMMAI